MLGLGQLSLGLCSGGWPRLPCSLEVPWRCVPGLPMHSGRNTCMFDCWCVSSASGSLYEGNGMYFWLFLSLFFFHAPSLYFCLRFRKWVFIIFYFVYCLLCVCICGGIVQIWDSFVIVAKSFDILFTVVVISFFLHLILSRE